VHLSAPFLCFCVGLSGFCVVHLSVSFLFYICSFCKCLFHFVRICLHAGSFGFYYFSVCFLFMLVLQFFASLRSPLFRRSPMVTLAILTTHLQTIDKICPKRQHTCPTFNFHRRYCVRNKTNVGRQLVVKGVSNQQNHTSVPTHILPFPTIPAANSIITRRTVFLERSQALQILENPW
jgi:hypothetical protein